MSSFTTDPILILHGLKDWEVFTPFTYYRDPILDEHGKPKDPGTYTEKEKQSRTLERIVVPAGFRTDLATIPRILWSVFPPHDVYAKAAILHDYMYDNRIGSKKEADDVFNEALGVLGVKGLKRKLLYWGVKFLGRGKY